MGVGRRQFLQAGAAAGSTLLLPTLQAAGSGWPLSSAGAGLRAVHQQQPYVDHSGTGESYWPAPANRSTVAYLNGLSEEEFLRRHWLR
jgi:hypothetical protein